MSDGAHPITDEFMRGMLAASRTYTLAVLTPGPNYDGPDAQAILWEHGRRNFELRARGTLAIVGSVRDDSDLDGVGIFTTDLDETAALLAQDPAIAAGVLVASVHPLTGFPEDHPADDHEADDHEAGDHPPGEHPGIERRVGDHPVPSDPAPEGTPA